MAWTLKLFLRELPGGPAPLSSSLSQLLLRGTVTWRSPAAAAVCAEKRCSPAATLLPPAKGSQRAQTRWAATLKTRLPLGQLDRRLVTFRATCLFRELLGGRKSNSYLLSLLLYFWWVSGSSLRLVWPPRRLNSRCLVSAILHGLGWHGSWSLSAPSGADPHLEPR